jgi:hypothetical protein
MNDMTMRSHPHRALRDGNVARHASSRRRVQHFTALRAAGRRIDIPASLCRRRNEHRSRGRTGLAQGLPRSTLPQLAGDFITLLGGAAVDGSVSRSLTRPGRGRVTLRLRRQNNAEQRALRITIARLLGEAHVRASIGRGDVLDHVLRDFRPLALDKHFIVIVDHA